MSDSRALSAGIDGPPAPKEILDAGDEWLIVTAFRSGLAGFDPAQGWTMRLKANQIYPLASGGGTSGPALDSGNGQNSQLTVRLRVVETRACWSSPHRSTRTP